MSAFSVVFLASIVLLGSGGLKLPDYITPCSRTDPNFDKCALDSGRVAYRNILKGDPKHGVPNLDPLFVKEMTMQLFGLLLTVRDLTVEGAKDAELQELRIDFDNLTIGLQFFGPLAVFKGKYEMSGKLLNMPMSGKGEFNVSFENVTFKYTAFFNLTKKSDGQTYLQPLDYKFVLDLKRGSCYFGNMFNGNKLLGDAMNNFLNENFLMIIEEVAQPSYKAMGMLLNQLVLGLIEKVPYDELFPKDS